jgi:hypothetical protein
MTLAHRDIVVGVMGFVIAMPMAPLLALALKRSRLFTASTWRAPVAVAVAVSWLSQIVFRIVIELPLNLEKAKVRGDLMYDGVGGNVAVFTAGWLQPLILCLALVGIMHALKERNGGGN